MAQALLIGQLEHPAEHGRHQLRMRDAVTLNQGQILFRLKALHDHGRAATANDHAHIGQGRGMVERRWRQVHHTLFTAPKLEQKGIQGRERTGWLIIQRTQDAFGPAGGTR